jgi:hypothetical protein
MSKQCLIHSLNVATRANEHSMHAVPYSMHTVVVILPVSVQYIYDIIVRAAAKALLSYLCHAHCD